MRMLVGIVIGGLIVIAANIAFVVIAVDVDGQDQVVPSYVDEAR